MWPEMICRVLQKRDGKNGRAFGVYTFKQVHQMISTVSCELKEDITFNEIIEATFPMASMTGAPKIRALELIKQYENFDREFIAGLLVL